MIRNKLFFWLTAFVFFLIPTLIFVFSLWLYIFPNKELFEQKFERVAWKNNHCYELKGEVERPNLIVPGHLDHPLLTALKIPSSLFDRSFCVENMSFFDTTSDTPEVIKNVELKNASGISVISCSEGSVLESGCRPLSKLDDSSTNYSISLQFICPTTYKSDLQKYGSREAGTARIEISLSPTYPYSLTLALLYSISMGWWAFLLVLRKVISIVRKGFCNLET